MSSHTVNFQINARLDWHVMKGSRGLIATCEPIGLSVEADDEPELKSVIEEALHYFFLDHFEERTLERFLQSKGWSVSGPGIDQHGPEDPVMFRVPWELVPNHAP